MKRILALSALCLALGAQAQTALPTSQAKKDLVNRILVLQQPDVEMLAKNLAQEPAGRMLQEAGRVLQSQVAEDKRDAIARSLEASARKYVDEAIPLVRAPSNWLLRRSELHSKSASPKKNSRA